MFLLLSSLASAGDVEGWVGGAVSATGGWQEGAQTTLQAELDASFSTDLLYGRVDLDVWVDPLAPGMSQAPPEYAYLQVGRSGPRAMVGVLNPNMGFEYWDNWDNYLPTFSVMFNGASPGRVLGADLGYTFESGTDVFVFGGQDIDWNIAYDGFVPSGSLDPALIVGGGVATEQDLWSTWSGVAVYPQLDFYATFLSFELYPHDMVWVTIDGGAGLSAGAPFAGGQLMVSLMPEALVVPVVRGEYIFDPDDAALGGAEFGIPDATASLGAYSWPLDWLNVQAEAKATFVDGAMSPGVYASVSVVRAEPEDEEEAPDPGIEEPSTPAQ